MKNVFDSVRLLIKSSKDWTFNLFLILTVVSQTLVAQTAPTADFTADATSGTVPLTVYFTDQSTSSPTSWLWQFGDGKKDTTQNPSHVYTQTGIYNVRLLATNTSGSDDTVRVALIQVTAEQTGNLPATVDLNATPSNVTRIYGDDAYDNSGISVSTGDINGDGFFDVIIGAYKADPTGGSDAGETYIVYGSSNLNNTTSIDLNSAPSNVTRIYGDDNSDYSGISVSTGDINGDGFFDVIIGAYKADPTGGSDAGETYIVYGSSNLNNTTSIDLNSAPSNVTRIYGDDNSDYSGISVSTGDINGDGFFDVIIGARFGSPAGGTYAGETYIVYGSSNLQNTTSIDLDTTPSNVTRIYGDDNSDFSGISVSTGDINGDGFFDVIIGAHRADPAGGTDAGETYIVYGSSNLQNTTSIDLNSTPSNVTRIYGDDAYDESGFSVSTGDINGDGFFDVIIGAYAADPAGGSNAGEAYIVYGSSNLNNTTSIDLNSAPSNVTRIYGDDANDNSGYSVSTGDINGDGFFDVIIGANRATPAGGSGAGETYIVYGANNLNNTTSIDLNGTPSNVTRIYGDNLDDRSGTSVATGDINGDGVFDVIIGAYTADPAGGQWAGETYVIYGGIVSSLSGTYTIGNGGDFTSFSSAVDSLNSVGVSGPVTFNVLNGTYTEQIEIGVIAGVSATDTIVFQSQSGTASDVTLNYAASGSSDNWVIKLNGADYITFRNMTLSATGASYARVFDLTGDADNNTINNNILTGKSTTSTSTNYAIIYSYNTSVNNTTISYNTFLNGSYGALLEGVSSSTLSQGSKVENNTFTDQGYRAVCLRDQDSPVINGNTITSSDGAMDFGIYAYYCDNSLQIKKNRISGIDGASVQLINCSGTAVSNGLVANNFVEGEGTSYADGIEIVGSSYQNIYYNSVNIPSASTTNRALNIQSGSNINVKNNIFSAPGGGYAYYTSQPSAIASSDYNDLYSTGNYVARWGSSDLSDLSTLQSASGMDANSVSVNPNFTSDSDLHTTTTWLDSLGTPVTAVTDDIDGEARDGTYPDIGADEFTAVGTPLSGTKTIGTGGDYSTFNEALDFLTTFGVSGPVIFNVLSGTYTEQIEIGVIAGVSATDTIVFQSQSGTASDVTLTYSATGSSDNWVVKLNGADYITFQNMTISATGTGSYARAFVLTGDADNNTITHNTLTGKSTTSSSTNYAVIYNENTSVDNTTISNNTFLNGGTGIYLKGVSSSALSHGTKVENNALTNQGYTGVYLGYQDAPLISGNTITSSDGAMDYGIYAYYCDNSLQIKKNRLSGIDGAGVQLINCSGTAIFNGLIANNFVEGEGPSYADGIEIVGSSYQNIYYNSVNIPGASGSNRALNIQSGSNINVKNNIFTTPGGGWAYYTSQPSAIASSDYNNLYSTGNYVARWGSSDLSDLSDLQSASGMETNSVSINPNFTSDSDLHTTTTWLDGKGTPLSAVTVDIDGEARDGTYPDIGADEFTSVGTPISGTKTIGTGGDYTTFTAAVNDLTTLGVSGPLTFSVISGTYTEQITLSPIAGVSNTNTITFQSQSGDSTDVTLTYSASGSSDNWVVKLNGADYITFQNMTISATSSGSYARVFVLTGDADNNTITNNTLTGKSTTSTSTNYAIIYSFDSSVDNTTISNNTLVNGSYGVHLKGVNSSTLSQGSIVENNTFTDQGYRAVYLEAHNAPVISNNIITSSNGSLNHGIYAYYCDNGLQIQKNLISGGKDAGIIIVYCDGTTVASGLIANNFTQVGGTSTAYGIYLSSSTYQNVYHNSVNITSTYTTHGRALYTTGGSNINVKNNVFANNGGGYAYYVNTTSAITSSDNNDLYSPGNNLANWGGSGNDLSDLTALQSASSMEANSVSINPNFTSESDLHTTTTWLDSMGTPLATVTDDIDGEARDGTYPDIGADEFIATGTALSGAKTIGDGADDYATFSAAVDALTSLGVSAAVTFTVKGGTYNEQINFLAVPGASSTNTVTFQSQWGAVADVTLFYSATGTSDNYVVKLNGADYITFKDMTFAATGANYARIFDLVGNADNNTITNNILSGNSTTSSSDNYALIFSEYQSVDNTVISNNTLVNGSYGVFMEGITESNLSSGVQIINNTFTDQYYRGVFLAYQDAPLVLSNAITTSSTTNSFRGIYASYCDNSTRIQKNRITGGRETGIYLGNCDGTFTAQGLIANNFIQVGGTSTAYGIRVDNSNYQNIYYNSVNVTGTSTSSGRALYTISGGNLNLANNIFANTGGGYAYYVSTTSAIATSNYNNFYATGTNLAYWGGLQANLTDLQTASGMDANSISSNPGFESTTDLHINVSNDGGIPLDEVTDDIDGEDRNASTPDMGADEFIPLNVDGIIEVPAEVATIQGAIDVAVNGDSIKVSPGTYVENINFNGKNIVVISTGGQDVTTIDGNQNGSVVTFNSGEYLDALLSGFTITNGSTNQTGGGIYCGFASPTIENCIIKGNTADSGGGISIVVAGANPTLLNLIIKENTAVAWGGGIQISGQATGSTIEHCIIQDNSAANGAGIHMWDSAPVSIKFTEISNNNGAEGIFFNGLASIDIINSTIANNSGNGLRLEGDNIQTSNIISSIIRGNTGSQIYSSDEDILDISYSNVADSAWAGTGNIDVDPLFVDAVNGDYSLLASSPCINAGNPDSTDSDGTIADMGAYPYLNTYSGPDWYVSTTGDDTTGTGTVDDPFASIQAGIQFANTGDSVSVAAGTYVENINFRGRAIKVFGEDRETTIIDGNQNGTVVTINSGETLAAVLSGFTIMNGSTNQTGGGIYCDQANPSLVNLIVSGNASIPNGGGISLAYSSPNIMNTVISGNTAHNGSGIFCEGSNPTLVNVTVYSNSAVDAGGGISCVASSNPSLVNSILWGNSPNEIMFSSDADPNTITISYSDIQGGQASIVTNDNGTVNWGDGNMDVDPLFVDAGNGNFNLTGDSPVIDAGNPASDLDPDGSIADMGAYYYDQAGQPLRVVNLTTTPGVDNIALKWAANSEANLSGYNVYRSTTTGANFSSVASVAIPDTEYVDSAIDPDVSYYYRVGAEDIDSDEGLLAFEKHGRVAPDSAGLVFDGITDYITVDGIPDFTSSMDYTVELWVKPIYTDAGFPYKRNLIERTGFILSLSSPATGELVADLTVGVVTLTGTTTLIDEEWHHIAVVINSSANTIKLWVDGYLESSLTGSGDGSGVFRISGSASPFDGVIDEVRVSNILRYTGGFVPPNEFTTDTNTLALWHFNEGSTDATMPALYDVSGNGYHGVIAGNPAWVGGPPFLPDTQSYLVINEIMQNPAAMSDAVGEWIEIYNQGFVPLHLDGWTLKDDGSDNHFISISEFQEPPKVLPGDYVVLGINADTTVNGDVKVDYQYSSFSLSNGSDEVILMDGMGNEIDRVAYDNGITFPDPTGVSMELIAPYRDNAVGTNWTEAIVPYGDGDLGSPRRRNDAYSGQIVVADTLLDFGGSVEGEESVLSFIIHNIGVKELVINTITTLTDEFNPSPTSVAVPINDSITVNVTFIPTTPNDFVDTLTIFSDDPNTPTVSIALQGYGISELQDIVVSSATNDSVSSIHFPLTRIGSPRQFALTVTNIGNAVLDIDEITITGDAAFSVDVADTLLSLNDSVVVTVTFDPSVEGDNSAVLSFNSNDPDEGLYTVQLTGIGSQYVVLFVPSEYSTIQTALDTAFSGDTVHVAAGTYVENIVFPDSNVVLRGAGPGLSIIDGNNSGTVVTITGRDSTTILEGFTIQNGSAVDGGGIRIIWGNPTLKNLLISGNTVSGNGGGIHSVASPTLENVAVSGNTAGNNGGGLFFSVTESALVNVTVSGNTAANSGGGIYCYNTAHPTLVNTILWNNSPQEVSFSGVEFANSITISYSDIRGGLDSIVTNGNGTVTWGDGNLDADPQFVDAGDGNLLLQWESPAIDAGDPSNPQDPDGTVIEMGAYYYDQSMQPPDPATNFVGFPGNGQVTITWSPPVDPRGKLNRDITGYIIYSGLQSNAMDSLAYIISDDTTYTDMGTDGHLINGEIYRYSVVAIDTSDLYGVPSDTVSIIPIGGAFVLTDTLHDFGQFDHNETGSWDLIIENTGNGVLNLSDISTSTSWFTVSDDSLTIPVAGTDTVHVTFWPDFTSGAVNDTITIISDDLDHPTVRIALSAESVWPVVNLSATELPFGDVKVYQPMTVPLTLYNDGMDTLFVDSIFVTTDTVFTVAVASGQTSLALLNRMINTGTISQQSTRPVYPVVKHTGVVRDERIRKTGNQRQKIGRKSSNDRKQKTVNRLMKPFIPPRPGAQAGNNKSGNSNIASTFDSDIIEHLTPSMTGIRISSNILPGDTLTLDITFFSSDTGSFESELRITSDDPVGNSDILIPLSARSIAPVISLSANALDFGNAWNGDSATVYITNVGTDTLHIVDIALPDDEFNTEITATDILPNATADLTVYFAPLGYGYWEGSLIISSNAYLANQVSIETKVIALPTETYDFGQILLNRDSLEIRNYDNGGNATLIIDSLVTTHAAFSVQVSSNSIAPEQTLQITTSFSPPDKSIYQTDEILYTSQIGDGFTIAQLSGEGITYPQSNFSTKSLSVVTYKGNDTQFSFELSNSGDFPLDYSIDVDADWFGFIWLELINTEGLVAGLSTNTILVNVVNMANLDPGTVAGRLYFNTNSGTTPEQIVRTDTVDIFLNLLADDTQLASGSAAISTGNPDPVNVLDAENNPIGLMLDFVTSSGGTVNVLRVDAYPPVDETTTFSDPSGLITNPTYAYEYFEISSDIPLGYTVHVGFDYTHLPGILDESKLRLARRVNNAGTAVSWDIVDVSETEIDAANGLIIARNQTQFSQWVILSNTGENLFLDVLAPAFGVPGYTPVSPGILEDIMVTIPITDESGIASVRLFYAEAGEWNYSEIAMVENGGEFSATIPGTVVTHSGVVYFITATDLLEYSSVSDTMGVEINFPNNDMSTSSVNGSAYSSGYPSEKWRMFSIPAILDNSAVTNVIGDELGTQADDIWRLFRYDANNQTYQDNPSNFNYGDAYWLYQTVENNIMFAATSGQTGNLNGSSITLKPLWNLIASPYSFPVSVQLDDILFYGPITYGQDGEGWTGEVSELKPWTGYAVYNKTGSDQTIIIDPIPQPGSLAKEQIEEGWLLNLSTTAGEYTDLHNPLGCLVSAEDGLDYHDNPELLAPGNYLSLTYTNPAWRNVRNGLTSDIRQLSEDVQIWDVSITYKGISDPVYLSWNFTQPLPAGQVTRVVDLARKEVLDTQMDTDHKIGKLIGDIPYRLKVISGYPEQVERTIEDIMFALPNEFALAQNYPNPFNPVTTLKFGLPEPRKIRLVVVNILGQEIVDLANGWYDLGYHQIRWDSRDKAGQPIASGVYFAILTDGKVIHVTKMIMLK